MDETTAKDSWVETLPEPVSEVVAVDESEGLTMASVDDSTTGAELTREVTLHESGDAVVDLGPCEELRETVPRIDVVEETKVDDLELADDDEEELSELE